MTPKTRTRRLQEFVADLGWRIPAILPGHKAIHYRTGWLVKLSGAAAFGCMGLALYGVHLDRWDWAIAGFIGFALAAVGIVAGWAQMRRNWTRGWEAVDATLLDHEIREVRTDHGRFSWRMRCEFDLGGRRHEATPEVMGRLLGLRRHPSLETKDVAEQEIAAYQGQERLPLWVDPEEPLACVIRREELKAPMVVRRRRRPVTRGGYVFPGVLVAVGLAIAAYGCKTALDAARSTGWPSTEGWMVESRLSSGTREGRSRYRYVSMYEYEVDGTRHQGDRWRIVEPTFKIATVPLAAVQRYPAGQAVTVYYDPRASGIAVLEPGLHEGAYGALGFGLGVAGFGGLMALFVRAGRRRSAARPPTGPSAEEPA